MKKALVLLSLSMALMGASAAYAQTGGITGIVVDADGVAVEGARVSIWLDDACQTHVFTDASGAFTFEDVAVGLYTLKAGKPKVGNATVEDVEVLEGEVTDVGTITLIGGGPHGPQGPKQNKFQHMQQEGQED